MNALDRQLIINANSAETRVALLENGRLAELFIERKSDRGLLGNIYRGKVSRVLPGMNAAFVDIGEARSAFLFGGDVIDNDELARRKKIAIEDPSLDFHELREQITQKPIEKLLRQGQEIVVQIIKEPIGSKGARASMFLSLAGRYLVLIPDFSHIGISRRITDDEDRNRLKQIVASVKPEQHGVIIRTAALEASEALLKQDLNYLIHGWNELRENKGIDQIPYCLYREEELHIKAIRDLYSEDIQAIYVDNKLCLDEITRYLHATSPGSAAKIKEYLHPEPIFDHFEIEVDLARALSRKVWLPSGGYLIVDQMEALTSFDVNTGKFVGKFSVRDTIVKTNLEALKEIAAQLRLRNIGGIIVIDFIDMDDQEDRNQIFNSLEDVLKSDKAKVNVLKISELGLVQMTRKRTSESLERILTDECPHCNGTGHTKSLETLSLDLLRDIERHCVRDQPSRIKVALRADLKEHLLQTKKSLYESIIDRFQVTIEFSLLKINGEDLKISAYEII